MATYIFDFDGTLADSFSVASDILLKQAKYLGCRQLTPAEVGKLRDLHAREVLNYLDVPFWRTFRFVKKFRKLVNERMDEVIIFPAWFEVLQKLKANQHVLGIISSNSRNTIEPVLKRYMLAELFDFIICEQPLFGKVRCLKKLVKCLNLNTNTTYYVADEVRDIEAAQANQMHAIAVSWGFNSVERLQLAKPELLIIDLKELTECF